MRKYVIVIGILVFTFACSLIYAKSTPNLLTGDKIALINIYGEITDTTHILELLHTYDNMKAVKGIVLRINSPGSHGMAASQEVYSLIREISKKGKPVVVSMGNIAASGAYYISAAADKIVANSGTLTGSIGVIMMFANAEVLLEKIGVNFTTIKTGKYKDIGSFSRPSTVKEKAFLQNLLDDALDQFVDDIVDVRYEALASANGIINDNAENKKVLVKEYMLKNIADGRIYTGRAAQKAGLVDKVGTIDDAIKLAAELTGINGRPKVITEKKKVSFSDWLGEAVSKLDIKNKTNLIDQITIK